MEKSKKSTERISAFLLYVVVLQPCIKLRNELLPTGRLSELLEYSWLSVHIFWSNSILNFFHNFNWKYIQICMRWEELEVRVRKTKTFKNHMEGVKLNDCIWKNIGTWKAWYQKERKIPQHMNIKQNIIYIWVANAKASILLFTPVCSDLVSLMHVLNIKH